MPGDCTGKNTNCSSGFQAKVKYDLQSIPLSSAPQSLSIFRWPPTHLASAYLRRVAERGSRRPKARHIAKERHRVETTACRRPGSRSISCSQSPAGHQVKATMYTSLQTGTCQDFPETDFEALALMMRSDARPDSKEMPATRGIRLR